MAEFKLPDVGEGLTEAEIVSWKVKVGDVIEINDVIVEIETAKSLVELPSPFAGTVLALMVDEGQMVEVGTPIISVGSADEAVAAASGSAGASTTADSTMEIDLSNPAASGGGEGESLVGRMKADRGPAPSASRNGIAGQRIGCRHSDAGPGCLRTRRGTVRAGGRGRRACGSCCPGTRAAPRGDGAPGSDGKRPRAGQAAGAQAGQGPRRGPGIGARHRSRRHRDP